MDEKFRILLNDTLKGYAELQLTDFAPLILFFIWATLLLIPLKRVDRSNKLAGLTYVFFCFFAGVSLCLALPQYFVDDPPLKVQAAIIVGIVATSSIRWFVKIHDFKSISFEVKASDHGRTSRRNQPRASLGVAQKNQNEGEEQRPFDSAG